MRETAHGSTYDPADFNRLITVQRDLEPVASRLSVLPQNRVAMVYLALEPDTANRLDPRALVLGEGYLLYQELMAAGPGA